MRLPVAKVVWLALHADGSLSKRRVALVGVLSLLVAGIGAALIYGGARGAEGGVSPRASLAGAWTRADPSQPALSIPGRMSAIVAQPNLLAAGGDADGQAVVWTSVDGAVWKRTVLPDKGQLHTQESINGITHDGGLFVAVGSQVRGGISRGAVWVSRDASQWQGPLVVESVATLHAVAVTPFGLIAVGEAGRYETADAAVLLSGDEGVTWRKVNPPALRRPGRQAILAVAATTNTIIAVGSDGGDGAAWTSPDGRSWSNSPARSSRAFRREGAQILFAVAVASGTIVAAGVDDSRPAIWTRRASRPWQQTFPAAPQGVRAGALYAIGIDDEQVIAAGFAVDAGDPNAVVVSSNNMKHWVLHRSESFGGQGTQLIRALAQANGALVAAGADYREGPKATAWISER